MKTSGFSIFRARYWSATSLLVFLALVSLRSSSAVPDYSHFKPLIAELVADKFGDGLSLDKILQQQLVSSQDISVETGFLSVEISDTDLNLLMELRTLIEESAQRSGVACPMKLVGVRALGTGRALSAFTFLGSPANNRKFLAALSHGLDVEKLEPLSVRVHLVGTLPELRPLGFPKTVLRTQDSSFADSLSGETPSLLMDFKTRDQCILVPSGWVDQLHEGELKNYFVKKPFKISPEEITTHLKKISASEEVGLVTLADESKLYALSVDTFLTLEREIPNLSKARVNGRVVPSPDLADFLSKLELPPLVTTSMPVESVNLGVGAAAPDSLAPEIQSTISAIENSCRNGRLEILDSGALNRLVETLLDPGALSTEQILAPLLRFRMAQIKKEQPRFAPGEGDFLSRADWENFRYVTDQVEDALKASLKCAEGLSGSQSPKYEVAQLKTVGRAFTPPELKMLNKATAQLTEAEFAALKAQTVHSDFYGDLLDLRLNAYQVASALKKVSEIYPGAGQGKNLGNNAEVSFLRSGDFAITFKVFDGKACVASLEPKAWITDPATSATKISARISVLKASR